MTYAEASEVLKRRPVDKDLARAAGVSVQLLRQARLAEASASYRTPPANWPTAVAEIARHRARELLALADRLEDL